MKAYLEKDVLEAINEAFWDGIDQGELDDRGEAFAAEDYLPEKSIDLLKVKTMVETETGFKFEESK